MFSFEGISGSGKSGLISRLEKALVAKKYQVLVLKEPGGTMIGDGIHKLLKKEMEPTTRLFLFLAARNEMIKTVVIPALQENKVVLCDRFIDSTVAYQGALQEFVPFLINQAYKLSAGTLMPRKTWLLDIPAEVGRARGNQEERLDKVIAAYKNLAAVHRDRFIKVDGCQTEKDVFEQVLAQLLPLL